MRLLSPGQGTSARPVARAPAAAGAGLRPESGATAILRRGDGCRKRFRNRDGADSEGKQELDPKILGNARVVADIAEQAARMGELQHVLAAGWMVIDDLHAELGQIVAGERPGRTSEELIFVFDSTGTALQDVAAAATVYERALAERRGREFQL